MEDNETDKNKNISGLSFKNLLSKEDYSEIEKEGGDGYLFLNDDIEKKTPFRKFRDKFELFVRKNKGKKHLLGFVISFFAYLYSRARVIWILSSVMVDLIGSGLDFFKEKFVRRMFWGRGGFLKSALQIIFLIVIIVFSVSYIYRKPVVIEASGDTLDSIGVAETDVLVMNATVNTLIPKDRGRRSVEEYTVKGGDTLSKIAQNFGITVETLVWANNMTVKSTIRPGIVLQIPQGDGVLVKVKKGDTLASLAKKYSANEQAIADFNFLDYPFTLTVGEELFLPEGKLPEPAKTTYASRPSFYTSNQYKGSTSSGSVDSKVGRFLYWPIAGSAKITQYFGYYHKGIDIASNALPSIVAPASGTVIFAGCYGYCPPLGSTYGGSNYAWSIQIDHGNGYTTWYAHLKNIYVRSGQKVSRGQVIGQMGSTGRSTGPHLHFELRRGSAYGTQINPIYYTRW